MVFLVSGWLRDRSAAWRTRETLFFGFRLGSTSAKEVISGEKDVLFFWLVSRFCLPSSKRVCATTAV